MSPIIGERGVAALFKRSLYLTREEYPCLEAVYGSELRPRNYDALRAALAQQSGSRAAAANGALMKAFYDLLTSLIGGTLADRLLRSVLDHPSSGHSVQDISP